MDSQKEKQAWREIKYSRKLLNALRGVHVFWLTMKTRDLLISLVAIFAVIIAGFYFNVSNIEWVALVLCIGFVIVSEVLNTAIEIDIDLTSPEYHPYARDTKDVAAAAVSIAVFFSIIVALIIFLPKIYIMIQ